MEDFKEAVEEAFMEIEGRSIRKVLLSLFQRCSKCVGNNEHYLQLIIMCLFLVLKDSICMCNVSYLMANKYRISIKRKKYKDNHINFYILVDCRFRK